MIDGSKQLFFKEEDANSNRMKIHWNTIAKIQKVIAKEIDYCLS